MAAFAPDIITQIGPLPITNTLIHTFLVDTILLALTFYLTNKLKERPHGLQNLLEPVFESIYSLTESIAPTAKSLKAIFPIVMTFFLFIFIANFSGLFPGVGTVGFFPAKSLEINEAYASLDQEQITNTENTNSPAPAENESEHKEFVPLLRGATSDINVTLALAIISVVATHILSIRLTGFKDYMTRWISLNPINLYVGILELVAEFTKVVSLSFRLFGNIYAGEVAIHTISSFFAFLAPIPFLLLESIVSIVQALVFSILTLVFMSVLTTPHHAHETEGVNHG